MNFSFAALECVVGLQSSALVRFLSLPCPPTSYGSYRACAALLATAILKTGNTLEESCLCTQGGISLLSHRFCGVSRREQVRF